MHPAGRGKPAFSWLGEPQLLDEACMTSSLDNNGVDLPPMMECDMHPAGRGKPAFRWKEEPHLFWESNPPVAHHSVCTAEPLGPAMSPEVAGPKRVLRKLHDSWGHASALIPLL